MVLFDIPRPDVRAGFIAEHGRKDRGIGEGIGGGDQPRNRRPIQARIGVGKQHEFGCCRSHADIAARAKAKIGAIADHTCPGGFRYRRAVIGACIIHDNHGKAGRQASQHAAQGGRAVIGNADNANPRQGR